MKVKCTNVGISTQLSLTIGNYYECDVRNNYEDIRILKNDKGETMWYMYDYFDISQKDLYSLQMIDFGV